MSYIKKCNIKDLPIGTIFRFIDSKYPKSRAYLDRIVYIRVDRERLVDSTYAIALFTENKEHKLNNYNISWTNDHEDFEWEILREGY